MYHFDLKGGIQQGHNKLVYRNSNKMSLKGVVDPGEGPETPLFLAQTEA